MKRVRKQIGEFTAIDPTADWSAKAAELYSGFMVAGPLDQTRELIPHVDVEEAGYITYLLVRWNRFRGIEARYNSVHQRFVESAARAKTNGSDAAVHELLAREYWTDIENELRTLKDCAEDISYLTCKLIRSCQAKDDKLSDIRSLSLGHWKKWESFAADEDECASIWEKRRLE